jgi:hypothetical protein
MTFHFSKQVFSDVYNRSIIVNIPTPTPFKADPPESLIDGYSINFDKNISREIDKKIKVIQNTRKRKKYLKNNINRQNNLSHGCLQSDIDWFCNKIRKDDIPKDVSDIIRDAMILMKLHEQPPASQSYEEKYDKEVDILNIHATYIKEMKRLKEKNREKIHKTFSDIVNYIIKRYNEYYPSCTEEYSVLEDFGVIKNNTINKKYNNNKNIKDKITILHHPRLRMLMT